MMADSVGALEGGGVLIGDGVPTVGKTVGPFDGERVVGRLDGERVGTVAGMLVLGPLVGAVSATGLRLGFIVTGSAVSCCSAVARRVGWKEDPVTVVCCIVGEGLGAMISTGAALVNVGPWIAGAAGVSSTGLRGGN